MRSGGISGGPHIANLLSFTHRLSGSNRQRGMMHILCHKSIAVIYDDPVPRTVTPSCDQYGSRVSSICRRSARRGKVKSIVEGIVKCTVSECTGNRTTGTWICKLSISAYHNICTWNIGTSSAGTCRCFSFCGGCRCRCGRCCCSSLFLPPAFLFFRLPDQFLQERGIFTDLALQVCDLQILLRQQLLYFCLLGEQCIPQFTQYYIFFLENPFLFLYITADFLKIHQSVPVV